MIHGVGVDLVAIERCTAIWRRHGARALDRLLAPKERAECRVSADPGRFLAMRFAAKEALGKALGTGIRTPVSLTAITVTHDPLGKPAFAFAPELAAWIDARGLVCHLSLADEAGHALAFVVVEKSVERT